MGGREIGGSAAGISALDRLWLVVANGDSCQRGYIFAVCDWPLPASILHNGRVRLLVIAQFEGYKMTLCCGIFESLCEVTHFLDVLLRFQPSFNHRGTPL
jgi:hypothetical protein